MTPPADSPKPSVGGLDRVLHEPSRLSILTYLLSHPSGLAFTPLKKLCDLTDGNLSRHLTALETKGLVEQLKTTAGRRPQTVVRLTSAGRVRFLEYLELLEGIVTAALAAAEPAPVPGVELNPA